jgi:PIF1-like helicase
MSARGEYIVTGTTFVINLTLSKVRSNNIALAAASGIAATLLEGGTKARSGFKISIDIDINLTFNPSIQSPLLELIRHTDFLF